jgi:hypothetical protein
VSGWRGFFTLNHERVARRLPPALAGLFDLLRPSHRNPWQGPLNGQVRRREIVRELADSFRFDNVIETGTHRGTTTSFFSTSLGVRVDTVEHDPRLAAYCRWRFALRRNVHVALGDSRGFLTELARQQGSTDETVLIYLDAHWGPGLPLGEELQIVGAAWRRAIVMIDDFEVPGDGGYGFDDYGPGNTLSTRLLDQAALSGWSVFYPRAASTDETGAKRGCVVLASPELAPTAHDVPSLRAAQTLA